MNKYKTQSQKLAEKFVTAVVIFGCVTLVACGVAISKINTDYMSTGVRCAKIVAERENEEIFLSLNDKVFKADENLYIKMDKILTYMPAPINTVYLTVKEIKNAVSQ